MKTLSLIFASVMFSFAAFAKTFHMQLVGVGLVLAFGV